MALFEDHRNSTIREPLIQHLIGEVDSNDDENGPGEPTAVTIPTQKQQEQNAGSFFANFVQEGHNGNLASTEGIS